MCIDGVSRCKKDIDRKLGLKRKKRMEKKITAESF